MPKLNDTQTILLSTAASATTSIFARCRARSPQPGHGCSKQSTQVRVTAGSIEIACDRASLAEAIGIDPSGIDPIAVGNSRPLTVAARLTRSGLAMRLVQGGMTTPAETHRSLTRLIVQARGWWKELRGGLLNVTELAAREELAPSYLTRVLRLAFLVPQVTDAVIAGKLKEGASVAKLLAVDAIDPLWVKQVDQLVGV